MILRYPKWSVKLFPLLHHDVLMVPQGRYLESIPSCHPDRGPMTFHLCGPSEGQTGLHWIFSHGLKRCLFIIDRCAPRTALGTWIGSFATVVIAPVGPKEAPRVSGATQSAIYLICSQWKLCFFGLQK